MVVLFKRFNPNADAKIDRHELQWALKENGHTLSPSEFERIFKYFDKNNEGFITIGEFVAAVRGELSQQRAALVNDIFSKVAPQGSIAVGDLVAKFDVKQSQSYRNGLKKDKEVRDELATRFDLNADGIVSP